MKFLGLRTIIYPAPDLEALKKWYIQATGVLPYFDEPFYVGFKPSRPYFGSPYIVTKTEVNYAGSKR